MLKILQSPTVINKCKKMFSQFGTPRELITDKDPNLLTIISNLILEYGILNIGI